MKWSSRDFSSPSSAEDEGRIIVEDRLMDGDVLDGPQPLIGSSMIALSSAGMLATSLQNLDVLDGAGG